MRIVWAGSHVDGKLAEMNVKESFKREFFQTPEDKTNRKIQESTTTHTFIRNTNTYIYLIITTSPIIN
jgi:hypothetical protein